MSATERRVIAVMPGARDAERTVTLLAREGIDCAACADLVGACRELEAGAGALLVAEESLIQNRSAILSETFARQPAWSALPVIVLGRGGSHPTIGDFIRNSRVQVTLVERPVRTRTLVSVVRTALRARQNQYDIRSAIAERERQASLLRDREERLEFALKAGRLGAWELQIASEELTCSELCKASFGREANQRFTYDDLRQAIHPHDLERVLEAVRNTIEHGTDYDVEYRNIWPDGSVHWVLVRARPQRDENGRATRLVGVSLDVTDKKRAEEELTSQAEQLRDSGRRKDEFLATLAHELRNPLAPIRTGLDVLELYPTEDLAGRARATMSRQLAHMVRLIDDLLEVSRITSGKVLLRREILALREVIETAVEASRPLIDGAKHELAVTLPEPDVLVLADSTRLAQVIGNILNNAAKYTPAGGHISIVGRAEAGDAIVEVTDDGLGIPDDQLDSVFEMFNQVNRTLNRSQGGLGIGLALVRELLALHGGTVRVQSAGPGRGSTFTVSLPLTQSPILVDRASEPDAARPGRRVLVVDDNLDAAEMLCALLELSGHETSTARNGASAVELAAHFEPEVVFLDIGLPDMDGYEVAGRLRTHPASRDAVLVAVTGWGSEEDKSRARQAGFDHHLTKPVDTSAINRILSG